ncbi:LysR substrate-binding domain-containing protein [Paraburkholderia sp. A1RI-2L]|uniref:LysR family transcriptional regulator n=1 Tax=Paraburkholderia sp. A1RI-2L TaxID=3028367 RepID=UPI003B8293F2
MVSALIDPVLLKSFVAVIESGSFTRAGERVHLTQSTISQQIKRLEEQLGCVLLDRSGPYIVATEEGEQLLGYAQRVLCLMEEAVEKLSEGRSQGEIRIGIPEDFATDPLTATLAQFVRAHVGIRLEVTVGLSNTLWQQFCAGEYDLVLVKQRPGQVPGRAAWPEPLSWIDSLEAPARMQDPLPLVVFPVGGLYRNEMIHALESTGRRWRISYTSASLASVRSAVARGIGLSVLPARLAQPGHQRLGCAEGFSEPPAMELAMHVRNNSPHRVLELADQLEAQCAKVVAVNA